MSAMAAAFLMEAKSEKCLCVEILIPIKGSAIVKMNPEPHSTGALWSSLPNTVVEHCMCESTMCKFVVICEITLLTLQFTAP